MTSGPLRQGTQAVAHLHIAQGLSSSGERTAGSLVEWQRQGTVANHRDEANLGVEGKRRTILLLGLQDQAQRTRLNSGSSDCTEKGGTDAEATVLRRHEQISDLPEMGEPLGSRHLHRDREADEPRSAFRNERVNATGPHVLPQPTD